MEEKNWEKVKEKLSKGYRWKVQEVRRKNKKRRAMAGMIVGVKKELAEQREGEDMRGRDYNRRKN